MSAMSATAVTNAAVAPTRECASSTSNAAFGSTSVRFALVGVSRRSVAVKASAMDVRPSSSDEEPKVSARQAFVGLLAAGAILVSGGLPAFAAVGPGGDGAAVTARRADKLLKKADKLTKSDSPARFTAQQAGSAAVSNVTDVGDAAVTKAKENLATAQASFGRVIVNKEKVSSDAGNVVATVKSKAGSAIADAKHVTVS